MNDANDNWWKRSCPSQARSFPEANWNQSLLAAGPAWDQLWRIWGGDLEVQKVSGRSVLGFQEVTTQVRLLPVLEEEWGFGAASCQHRRQVTTLKHWCPVCKIEKMMGPIL